MFMLAIRHFQERLLNNEMQILLRDNPTPCCEKRQIISVDCLKCKEWKGVSE